MQHAAQVEPALFRKLEDLNNELAYIDHYPERWDSQEARLVRRVAVIHMIAEVRTMLITWAMPIELAGEQEKVA
jgi:hypothetical protein